MHNVDKEKLKAMPKVGLYCILMIVIWPVGAFFMMRDKQIEKQLRIIETFCCFGLWILFVVFALDKINGSHMDESSKNKTMIGKDSDVDQNQYSLTELLEPTTESEEDDLLPDDFDEISNNEKIIDSTSLVDVVTECLEDIGVSNLQKVVFGNYREDSTSAVIDGFVITDTNKKLLVDAAYEVNKKWSVMEVKDVDTENSYYVEDDLKDVIDLYDYKTGKRLENNQQTPKPTKKTSKKKKSHRKGMYGISKKDIHDIDGSFRADKVRNDVTGNWRISTIAANVNMEKYALSYYKSKFRNDDEIHGIVNFNNNTTTKISVMGNMLDVTVHEYVKGEEHDANLLFSGMVLKEYHVYLDNGDIKKIQ